MSDTALPEQLEELNELSETIFKEESELAAKQETLDNQELASKTIRRGQRRYNLVDFLLEGGDIPEAYTVNKAKELLGVNEGYKVQDANIIKTGQNAGKVPAFVAVDEIADEAGMSADDFLKAAKEIRQTREDIEGLKAYIKSLKEDYNESHKAIPKAELDKWQVKSAFDMRSPQSQAADLARQHTKVIKPDDKYILKWVADTTSADVQGIDTPKDNRRTIDRRNTITRSRGARITPPKPRIMR